MAAADLFPVPVAVVVPRVVRIERIVIGVDLLRDFLVAADADDVLVLFGFYGKRPTNVTRFVRTANNNYRNNAPHQWRN